MSIGDENHTSRHSSPKRPRSISLSLKSLFKSSGSSINVASHTRADRNKNIYTNHNVKNTNNSGTSSNKDNNTGRRSSKTKVTAPVLTPIKTTDISGQNKSSNESKLSKLSQAKALELQNSRNNNSSNVNIHTPVPQSAMAKLSSGFVNSHSSVVSPVSIGSDVSTIHTPKLCNANVTQISKHNMSTSSPSISGINSPLSPIHLPNIEKLSLSQIPSNLLYSHDTILVRTIMTILLLI